MADEPGLAALLLLGSVELHAVAPSNVALATLTLTHGVRKEAALDFGNWQCLHSQVICLFVSALLAGPQTNVLRRHQ